MKHLILTLAALGAATSLAACSKKEEAPETATAPVAAPAAALAAPASDMASGEKMAKGTGTVTALDPAAGTITLDHAPIPEANWPAMTMAFKAAPDVAKQVKVGDKVAFDLKLKDGGGEVAAISKQ